MFITGQKVVCIDGKFPLGIERYYDALPKEGVTYVVRGLCPAIGFKHEDEICVYLIGLTNPKSNKPPFPERGFKCERFRPLEDLTEEEIEKLANLKEKEIEHVN